MVGLFALSLIVAPRRMDVGNAIAAGTTKQVINGPPRLAPCHHEMNTARSPVESRDSKPTRSTSCRGDG